MILVDTHVLIWHIEGEVRLGERAREQIEQSRVEDGVLISAISAWEVGLLCRKGRVRLSRDPEDWLRFVLALPGYFSASVEMETAMQAAILDWPHRDPADRLLVATAIRAEASLLTADHEILDFAETGHIEAIDARR